MEDKKITPQEELDNMENLLARIVDRAAAYAMDDNFKQAKGSFQQVVVRASEARFWLLSGIGMTFPQQEEKKEEVKEEVKNEPATETN